MENCSSEKKLTLNLASQKGTLNWLSVLPLKRYNFSLSKSEIKDGLHLSYGWEPTNTPHTCPCGKLFTLTHSLHCPKGGYTHLRHNESRDTFATLLDEVCHDVEIEMCHSPGLAQRSLPSQHKSDIRGLNDQVLLKRRLEYSGILNFQKFDCRQSMSEKYREIAIFGYKVTKNTTTTKLARDRRSEIQKKIRNLLSC